jgi:PTS system cellobiose-specific IIB component
MKIVLVCSAGMSTSLLVEAMRHAASEQQIEAEITSAGAEQLADLLPSAAVVLVAPQIRHRFARIAQAASAAGVPAVLLDQRAYGLVDGAAALAQALAAEQTPPAG